MAAHKPPPVVPEEDASILKQSGYDVAGHAGSGEFGHVFRGVCNELSFKRYEIPANEKSKWANHGTIWETPTKTWVEKSLNGKNCAIKLLFPQTNKNVLKEASVLLGLNHPNIVEIYYVMTTESRNHYIIMEYINGGTLKELVERHNKRRTKFTELDVKIIFQELVDGLGYLHRNGVAHYDLHLGNIMIHIPDQRMPDRYQIKIVDFGLSEMDRSKDPEQSGKLDLENDMSSLAHVFTEVLKVAKITTPSVKERLEQIITNLDWNHEYVNIDQLINDLIPVLATMMAQNTQQSSSSKWKFFKKK